jgi:four helix bundle protein
MREKTPAAQYTGTDGSVTWLYSAVMRQLESLDAWRTAQQLAEAAYRLTMTSPLDRHFALIDQIRRAAVSIPANMAEGYALSTTEQFIRCLRISLGSAAELRTHLDLVRRLKLAEEQATTQAIDLCTRAISLVVGLLRKLGQRSRSRFPFPVSRFPIKPDPPTSS